MTLKIRRLIVSLLKSIWIWGLLTWGYVIASVLDPVTAPSQTAPLSYYVWIPTNLVGVSAFIISFIAFVLWESFK